MFYACVALVVWVQGVFRRHLVMGQQHTTHNVLSLMHINTNNNNTRCVYMYMYMCVCIYIYTYIDRTDKRHLREIESEQRHNYLHPATNCVSLVTQYHMINNDHHNSSNQHHMINACIELQLYKHTKHHV